jgi:hypothetical protein
MQIVFDLFELLKHQVEGIETELRRGHCFEALHKIDQLKDALDKCLIDSKKALDEQRPNQLP